LSQPSPSPAPRSALFAALVPLVLFYAVESWYGLRPAVLVSMVASLIDVGWSWRTTGQVPRMTVLTAGLVLVLGGLSLWSDDERYVLWTPVIGDWVFAGVLVLSTVGGGSLLEVAMHEQRPDEPLHRLERAFLRGVTLRFAANLALHGVVTAWAAGGSRELWLLVSGPVLYGMMGVQMAGEVVWGRWVVGPAVDAEEEGAQ
jgi:intracellular septation protein A